MTKIGQNIYATDLDDDGTNSDLSEQGYSIRYIENWHRNGHSDGIIIWDGPPISEADLPF